MDSADLPQQGKHHDPPQAVLTRTQSPVQHIVQPPARCSQARHGRTVGMTEGAHRGTSSPLLTASVLIAWRSAMEKFTT